MVIAVFLDTVVTFFVAFTRVVASAPDTTWSGTGHDLPLAHHVAQDKTHYQHEQHCEEDRDGHVMCGILQVTARFHGTWSRNTEKLILHIKYIFVHGYI